MDGAFARRSGATHDSLRQVRLARLDAPMFASFFMGGFECSTQRRGDGRRLDLLAATGHEKHVLSDYAALKRHGVLTVRDGLRWHLIERPDGSYDWSTFLPMLRSADALNMQVIWDLCHYGWPDHIDIWSPDFVELYARFAAAVAAFVRRESDVTPIYCPINEMSYWAWAGGEAGRFNPQSLGRGRELKVQLCRAAIAATKAIRAVDPSARFITAEPLIHVAPRSLEPDGVADAAAFHAFQFEAADWLLGVRQPELGGEAGLVDVVGVNFYPQNQWYHEGHAIPFGHHDYRPLSDLLAEVHDRYRKPILISETGSEGSSRAAWLHYVCQEVGECLKRGISIVGICLYPIVDYPGWDNERACAVGLLSGPDDQGRRLACQSLADELTRQRQLFSRSVR